MEESVPEGVVKEATAPWRPLRQRIRGMLSLYAALTFVALHVCASDSQWVHPGPDGRLIYKTTPSGDRIMDFSHAGYMGGGVALPNVPVKQTLKPSGDGDDTAAIQSAINAVAALRPENGFRGAVLLAPGTFSCSNTITISASGVVLRGSGHTGATTRTTIRLTGQPHNAITIRASPGRRDAEPAPIFASAQTTMADAYVPSGTARFAVSDATGFAVGDTIELRRPVTAAWIKFMQMDDLVRDGKAQTWLRAGSSTTAERRIASISRNTIAVDVPLSDSFDSRYLSPPGTAVVKIRPPVRVSHVGIESLHIESPPQEINHTQPHFTALRLTAEDSWVRDVVIDETMNSVGINGRRLTLLRVAVNRKARHQGSSKPAEFAPNAGQVLLDHCTSTGDNVWYAATGGGVSGPIVLLHCTFLGNGRAESHQRWSTGMLYDNCRVPDGGIDFRNRGSMGSGHGWSMGWGVAWNCQARDFVIQSPPGAANWMIGCLGENKLMPRPFGSEPNLAEGIKDSHGTPVTPKSLYLAQLAERLGPQALQNIGATAE
jgi:hypothetical protein